LKLALVLDNIAELRAMDTSGQKQVFIPPSSFFRYDAADTATADDGVNCIADLAGRRYKLIPTSGGGGGGGSGIAYQTAIAGTANQLNVTATGIAALSGTPQWLMITPQINNTGAAQISFDSGATSVPVQKANGSAVLADELTATIPVLGLITSSSFKILFYGAT
jgi:tetrahydromethanopterin S-methyltransferase subunit H